MKGVKRVHIGDVHEEFVRAKAARGLGIGCVSGLRGTPRRGRDFAVGSTCRVQRDSPSAATEVGGGDTDGTTAAEVTRLNTVPSSATAVVAAQCSEVQGVTSAAVPVRRRVTGKRSDPRLQPQPAIGCAGTATLGDSLRGDREATVPGRRHGLTGRPPD
jgi:hypothetical protein